MSNQKNYFKMDIYRLWHSKKILLGIVLVYAAMMLNSFLLPKSIDVLFIYFTIRTFSSSVLVYIGCAAPFATAFAEDFEYKFISPQIVRGTVGLYALSKVLVCFFSAVFCMISGVLLFVWTYSFKYPLCDVTTNIFEFYVVHDVFGGLLASGHYLSYFTASACLTGMLGGLLGLIAMYLSLFLKNKLFVISIPMMAHYFVDNYILNWLKLPAYFSPVYTFSSEMGAWELTPIKSILYAYYVTITGIVLFTLLIAKKIRKEL